MARKRKNEMKTTVKSSLKYIPIRKSSRQIAKKQLEEKRVNGDILQTSTSNNIKESCLVEEDQNQTPSKKNQNSQKKHQQRSFSDSETAVSIDNSMCNVGLQYKRDAGESDSQDGLDNVMDPSHKLSPEDVRQMVVGNPNPASEPADPATTEVEMWPEDVIEETIICEEMEVEGDVPDSGYTIEQGNVMVERVLLMDEPHMEGKDFVEFTVIQNSDGTESMVMNSDNVSGSRYQIVEESVDTVQVTEQVTEPESSVSALYGDDESLSSNNDNYSEKLKNFSKSYVNKKKNATEGRNCKYTKEGSATAEKVEKEQHKQSPSTEVQRDSTKEESSSSSDFLEEAAACQAESTVEPKEPRDVKNDSFCKIDDKMAGMQISESSKEIQKLVNDLSNLESIDSPVRSASVIEKISSIDEDDESNSSILDKMEQLHQQSSTATTADVDIYQSAVEQNDTMKNEVSSNASSYNEKPGSPNQLLAKNRTISSKKTLGPRTAEGESKIDGEDMKSSSSSENSSDTLLSINNCKVRDNDMKGTCDGEKKVEFRSRSGSTDTTGSESGSNSSGVRRSSRIRSIGLMKQQRSRGRGLVTKSSVEVSKSSLHQDREKLTNNAANVQESKSNQDSNSEPQCDKDSGQNKVTTYDTLAPLASSCNTTGYDSDSSKPVKVKSRWRRSSELEMGGSSSGFSSITGPTTGAGYSTNVTAESGSRFLIKSGSAVGDPESSESGAGQTVASTNSQTIASVESSVSDSLTNVTNSSVKSSVPPVPSTVGAKISLPMVLEMRDREMEERLSQFEYLRENLYLTERYTNKETKRMVCDCFLTEEEIERGELGCGEDCLNRLLMIECGTRCVVGDRCTNKRFQNCEYAKCEVFRTEKKGFGLRAVVDLLAGEFIMEYVGEVVDPKDFRRRAKEYSKDKNKHYYFMALKSDQIIDATMKGNVSRFINHSCDPNSETQKWTVNGELRIGFFNKKFIAAGEEITFDYHFQRYGKEAQKCFCEAPNCRGWIGDTPEEEKEKIEKKEKREKDSRKKKEEKKPTDYMEDEDLEEEIDKLCSGGLKNRAHTLTLSRLMVRSRELEHRTRLLRLIQSGEQPCRRLFLDYHGLRLIWSYVMDLATTDSEEAQQFRLEVLRTLNTLPIPNKTMLMDSKIYGVIENWSKRLYLSPNSDSPDDDQVKVKTGTDEQGYESNDKKSPDRQNEIAEKSENSADRLTDVKTEADDQTLISDLAASLLAEWSNLKEVFRIPKKERIEQMKEHEREADRGYREELEKEEKRGTSYDRHRSDRYGRNETDKRTDRKRGGRESPESDHSRMKDKRTEERSSLVPIPRMTKYERRQLFALKVAKEEEERQRRQQQESWQDHEARCMALGIDPHATAMMDPQTGYPVFYNPSLGQWQHYPTQDRGEISQQCTPVYVGGPQSLPGHSQPGMVPQSPHILPPMSSDISPGIAQTIPNPAASSVYSLNQTPVFNQTTTSYSLLSHRHQPYPDGQVPLSSNLVPVHGGTPPMPIPTPQLYLEKPPDRQFSNPTSNDATQCRAPQPEIPPIDLPPKWKSATDARGRTYYYHTRERIPQWLPPPPDHIGVQPDSSSTSESSEESSSSNEEEDEAEDEHTEEQNKTEDAALNPIVVDSVSPGTRHGAPRKVSGHAVVPGAVPFPEPKKRRDGLVQERIISPRREEDRMDHKTYKEIKEKLRRQKERAKLREHVEKLRKHRRSNKSKSHSRHNLNKLQSSNDVSAMSERKIKDTFRINMANVMVHFLNPYRKNDCKQGRITNTEDFKHLARKLTHFVLAKELKHCKSVDELQCNENVKHKAKDFVRKYMSKFGAVYQKGTDED